MTPDRPVGGVRKPGLPQTVVTLLHVLQMSIAYLLSSMIVAALYIVWLGMLGGGGPLEMAEALVLLAMFTIFAAVIASFPAIPLIVFGEMRKKRSLVFSLVSGVLSALPMPYLLVTMSKSDESVPSTLILIAMTVSLGLAGGAVYWLLAARSANRFEGRPLTPLVRSEPDVER